jgi:hypothetical protein
VLPRLVTAVATPFGRTTRTQGGGHEQRFRSGGTRGAAICESMLLSLTENKIIDEAEARAILEDAAAAHRNAIPLLADGAAHDEAATLIEAILKGATQCGEPELRTTARTRAPESRHTMSYHLNKPHSWSMDEVCSAHTARRTGPRPSMMIAPTTSSIPSTVPFLLVHLACLAAIWTGRRIMAFRGEGTCRDLETSDDSAHEPQDRHVHPALFVERARRGASGWNLHGADG